MADDNCELGPGGGGGSGDGKPTGITVTAIVGGVGAGNFATDIASFLGAAGTGLPSPIFNHALAGTLVGRNVSSVALNIDRTSLPALPVGTYTGTLHFMAVAI